MFDILCKTCSSVLFFDKVKTVDNYVQEVDYVKNTLEDLESSFKYLELMYFCPNCNKNILMSFDDVFNCLTKNLLDDIKNYRKLYAFRNVASKYSINPDNGLEFCGSCSGVDNEGNCYKDVIKYCPFRNKNNEL